MQRSVNFTQAPASNLGWMTRRRGTYSGVNMGEVVIMDAWQALQDIADRVEERRSQRWPITEELMVERHNECERITDEIELFVRRLKDSGASEHMLHSADMWLAVSKDFLSEFGAK